MSDPKSLRVIKHLEDALKRIKAPDFNTDAGLRTSRGRRRLAKDEQFPLIILHEGTEEVNDYSGSEIVQNSLNVTIEGWIEVDPLNPTDQAHLLLADIKKSLFPAFNSRTSPGLFSRMKYLGRVIEPPEDNSRLCSVSVLLSIDWTEHLTDPTKT